MTSDATTDPLRSCARLLEEIDARLAARSDALAPDLRALLLQRDAVSRAATGELVRLLEQSGELLEAYSRLRDKCVEWRDAFLVPLRDMCDELPVENPVSTRDLRRIIGEFCEALGDAEPPGPESPVEAPAPDASQPRDSLAPPGQSPP